MTPEERMEAAFKEAHAEWFALPKQGRPVFGAMLIEYAAAAIREAVEEAERGARSALETDLWAIIDRDGFEGVPSDIHDAVKRLSMQSKGAEAALAEQRAKLIAMLDAQIEAMDPRYEASGIEVWRTVRNAIRDGEPEAWAERTGRKP